MPTLFERIDTGLQENDVAIRLSTQAGNIGTVATTITNLIQHPPQGIGDLGRTLNEIPLPDLEISGSLATTLTSLQDAVPTDLSSVTGDLVSGLGRLSEQVGEDLSRMLKDVLDAVMAVYRLTQIDFTCEGAGKPGGTSEGGSGGGAGTGGSSGTGSDSGGTGETGSTSAATTTAIDNVNSALDLLPSPLTVESLLSWLRQATDLPQSQREAMLPFSLPVIDDLRDPLDTLCTLKSLDAAGVRSFCTAALHDTAEFIRGGPAGAMTAVTADLTDMTGKIHGTELAQIADSLATRLGELRSAVTGGDLSGTGPAVAAINALLDQYETVRTALQTEVLGRLDQLFGRLADLPADLQDQIEHVIAVLQPGSALGAIPPFNLSPEDVDVSDALAEVEAWLNTLVAWLQDLLDKINLTAVKEPLITVADNARSAVDGLDNALATVTLQVQGLFGRVETLLNQVDMVALAAEVQKAIDDFKTELVNKLTALFAPVRNAVQQGVTTIDQGVDQFEPEEVVDGLKDVIATLTSVLEDPAVIEALNQIRNALETATQQVKALSFTPVTEEVVKGIEEIADILRGIDTSKLNTALQLALQAALAVLPEDLTPATDPLIDEFGNLIETGPVPLVEKVREQPEKLLDKVRNFEPAALVGDALSKPYNDLLKQMEAFNPSQLLKPVEAELEKLRDRLRKSANPGQVIKPLEQPFNELLQAFDRLEPEDLVTPLEKALSDAINKILDALPVDEVIDQVEAVMQKVQEVADLGDRIVALLQRIHDLLGGLADAPDQVEAWVNSALSKIDALGDPSSLQPALAELTAALDAVKSAALKDRFDSAADPLISVLETLDSRARITALLQLYRSVSRQALAALPDSPEKTAVTTAALDRFDPLQPAFNAPWQALAGLRDNLTGAKTAVHDALADWDDRYHGSDALLASLRQVEATAAELKQQMRNVLETRLIRPLKALFAPVEPVRAMVSGFLAQVRFLVTSLKAKLADLLLGPDSLTGILDSVRHLEQRLRNFNLGFLTDSLNDLFAQVREKLDAVNPAHLRQTVEKAFDDMLKALKIDLVLPAADVSTLDSDYAEVIAKLKALDPKKLVTDVVQPEFEKKVVPLLETFDVTELLTALIDRLRALDDELKKEMERVNDAFKTMRQAVPSVSLGLDVGISL